MPPSPTPHCEGGTLSRLLCLPIFSCCTTLYLLTPPKASLLFLDLTELCHILVPLGYIFFWPSNDLPEPPAATSSPSSWLPFITCRQQWEFYSPTVNLSQDMGLGTSNWLPIDSGRLGEPASSCQVSYGHVDFGSEGTVLGAHPHRCGFSTNHENF